MRKFLAIVTAGVAYVAALNLTAFIADRGFGLLSVVSLAAAMVGGAYVVDRMI